MDDFTYTSWKDFNEQQYRKANTIQLSIDELARDLYYDDSDNKSYMNNEELNFDD